MTVTIRQFVAAADLTTCPACAAVWSSQDKISIPAVRLGDEMLSGPLVGRLNELTYERCGQCKSLIATDARRDRELLNEIYHNLPQSYWQQLNSQAGLSRLIERHLKNRGTDRGDLWDVGCGSGSLLASFGRSWNKAGIEPGVAAVEQAKHRGLKVVVGTASSLRLKSEGDVALLIDVVEHLPDPAIEFEAIFDLLRPGGIVVVLTGVADAWTARYAGPLWYYLHCVGHVTVFSQTAVSTALQRAGFKDISVHLVEHPGAVGLIRWLKRIGGNAIRRVIGRPPGAMHHFRDHQLVLAVKPTGIAI